MPNQQPIWTRQGDLSSNSGVVLTANMGPVLLTATGDYTGVSGNYKLVFTSDSVNGSYLQRLRFKSLGTNVATVARIFINNGGLQTISINNGFYGECTLPAVTASNTSGTIDVDYIMTFAIPPGFRVYAGLATTVAAGWGCMPVAGLY